MLAKDHKDYEYDCPEEFSWHRLCSRHLDAVCQLMKKRIMEDFETGDRLYVPGLRDAFRIIADYAEVLD